MSLSELSGGAMCRMNLPDLNRQAGKCACGRAGKDGCLA